MTSKQVAEAAGVSRSTVQRALSGDSRIARETKEKILKVARGLGYRPNRHARALVMRQQKPEYAAILTVPENVFMREVLKGISRAQEELKDFGVRVAIHFLETIDGQRQAELMRRLVSEGKKGIVFIAIDCDEVRQAIAEGTRRGTAFLSMVTDVHGSKRICFVGQENKHSGRVAGGLMNLLLPRSAKVACFIGSRQFRDHMDRYGCFRDRFCNGIAGHEIVDVIETGDHPALAEKLTRELFDRHPALDGIFVAGAGLKGVCDAVRGTGRAGKVKMVTYDIVQSARFCRDGVIDFVIDQDPVQEGYRALSVLNSYIMYGEIPPDKMYTRIDIRTRDLVDM